MFFGFLTKPRRITYMQSLSVLDSELVLLPLETESAAHISDMTGVFFILFSFLSTNMYSQLIRLRLHVCARTMSRHHTANNTARFMKPMSRRLMNLAHIWNQKSWTSPVVSNVSFTTMTGKFPFNSFIFVLYLIHHSLSLRRCIYSRISALLIRYFFLGFC